MRQGLVWSGLVLSGGVSFCATRRWATSLLRTYPRKKVDTRPRGCSSSHYQLIGMSLGATSRLSGQPRLELTRHVTQPPPPKGPPPLPGCPPVDNHPPWPPKLQFICLELGAPLV